MKFQDIPRLIDCEKGIVCLMQDGYISSVNYKQINLADEPRYSTWKIPPVYRSINSNILHYKHVHNVGKWSDTIAEFLLYINHNHIMTKPKIWDSLYITTVGNIYMHLDLYGRFVDFCIDNDYDYIDTDWR